MKKGWQLKQLGELAELKGRIGWRGLTAKEYTMKGPLFLSVHSLNYGDYVDFRDAFHISEERYVESPEIMLQKDDVLICKDGAGIGKVGIMGKLPDRATINSSLLLIRSGKEILPKFLYRCLCSPYFQQIVNSRLNGATTPHLYQRDITEFPIVLPPLAEQQRIVGLLDEAFEGLATAKANAEKNHQNARTLFESHLQSVFSQRGPGWVDKSLGNLCEVFADGDWVESKDQSLDGVRLIQTGNVGEGVFKDRADKARYISEATFKRLRCTEIFEGDCLISRLPDPVGRSCILPDTGERMITAVDCTIVRFDKKRFLPELFNHYSQSDDYLRTVAKECTGTTRNRISRSNLALTSIPVPPLQEQKRLAAIFDALTAETQRLARLYERKLAALEALKKSLLHQAFSGHI